MLSIEAKSESEEVVKDNTKNDLTTDEIKETEIKLKELEIEKNKRKNR